LLLSSLQGRCSRLANRYSGVDDGGASDKREREVRHRAALARAAYTGIDHPRNELHLRNRLYLFHEKRLQLELVVADLDRIFIRGKEVDDIATMDEHKFSFVFLPRVDSSLVGR